jgi:DNA invertase Pin-like site-specific DNA recombinase
VSTTQDSQEESLETQEEFFKENILAHSEWEYAGLYSDRQSGTSVNQRKGFLKMIDDALDGKIDTILTKSVSRFSRDAVDLLHYTEVLSSHGVNIVFLKEGLDTSNTSTTMILRFMASIAQNESYSISENIRTANRKRFTKGKYSPGNHVCLGYKAEDGKLVPDENADVVRAIFDLFLQGKRYQGICDELNAKQSATKRGSTEPDKTYHLTRSTVKYILHNEVYVGDKNLLRTPRRELFSKLPVKTESIYIKYDHEPLIDRETWEEAQKRLESLSKGEVKVDYKHKGGKPHFLHGKVICGECASLMTRRTRREYRKKGEKVATYKAWICSGRVKGSGCQGRIIREDEVLAVIRVRLGYSPKRKVDAAAVEGVQEIRVGEEDVEVRMNES